MSFDPYTAWLQVPDRHRPPNHYQLFGLPTLEPNVERIRAAAMDRIALVRKYQLGQHADDAMRLLGEMSRAFDCLTDAQRKLDYDRQLGNQPTIVAAPSRTVADVPLPPQAPLSRGKVLEPSDTPPAAVPKPVVLKSVASPTPIVQATGSNPAAAPKSSDSLAARRRRRNQQQNQTLAIAAGVVVLVGGGILWLATRGDAPTVASTATATNSPITKPKGGDVALPVDGRPAKAASAPQTSPVTTTTIVPSTNSAEAAAAAPGIGTAAVTPTPADLPAVVPVTTIQPQVAPDQPAVEPLPPGPAIDVLKLINVNRDALKGQWQRLGSGNVSAPNGVQCAALELPVDPPEQYVLTLHSIRPQNSTPGTLAIGLVSQGSPFIVVVDGNGKVGLEMVDGRMFNSNETTHVGGVYPGTPGTSAASTVFVCTVLKSRVKVTVDGKPVIDWQGDPRRLALFNVWPVRNRRRLFVGAHSTHLIRKIELSPIEGVGGGSPAPDPVPTVTPPSVSPSPNADYLAKRADKLLESLAATKAAPSPMLAESMLNLLDEALQNNEFDLAARLAAAVPQVADEVKDATARKELRVRINEAKKAQPTWLTVGRAKQRLTTNADDPVPNLVYGYYVCLTKGDWNKGLPMLAKSTATPLGVLARDDLANPSEAKTRLELGDRWWEQALSAATADKPQFKVRAGHWYELVLPELSGLERKRVEGRMAQIAPSKSTPATAGSAPAARGGLVAKYRGQLKLSCSSFSSGYEVAQLVDGKPNTSWYTAAGDSVSTGKSPWFMVEFPEDIAVSKVLIAGNRDGFSQLPYHVNSAVLEVFDKSNKSLRTMTANSQGPAGDFEFNLKIPARGARYIRFQSVNDRGSQNGLGEIALGEIEVE